MKNINNTGFGSRTTYEMISAGPGSRRADRVLPRTWVVAQNRQRASGMILLLVIAILVLLAVMGSVYVLMAGADRQSTNASNGNASLALAQASVLNIVRGQIGTQLTDGKGYYLNGSIPTAPYARTWDMPQLGNTTSIAPTSPAAFYGDTGDTYRSEPWLVSLPAWMSDSYFPPNTEMLWSGVDPTMIQTGPAALEIGYYAAQATTPNIIPAGNYTTPPSGFTAVSPLPGVSYPLFSMLSPFLYDPATGINDIGMSYQLTGGTPVTTPGTQGTVYVPNASVVFPAWSNYLGSANREGIDDSCWNMLPYSSPNGTRYRFAVRIMDENSMLNLNVGQAGVAAYNPGGQYFNGYSLSYEYDPTVAYFTTNSTSNPSDATPAQMTLLGQARSNNGSFSNYPIPSAWQQALWTRDVGGTDSALISLFGSGSTLALQSYEGSIPASGMTVGTGSPYYNSRPGGVLPNTLGFGFNDKLGQPWKLFFTSYSKDRPLRTEQDTANPPYGLTSAATYSVNGVNWQEWPASPGKIFVNAPADSPALVAGSPTNTNTTGTDVPGGIALTAAQIAQAMGESGFTSPNALGFAANYMTYRMGVAQGVNPNTGALLTTGPCFIDSKGVNIRGIGVTPVTEPAIGSFSTSGQTLVAGIAAQPFINEVAVVATNKTGSIAFSNYAVELFNPFESPIDLSGWQLSVLNPGTKVYVSGATFTFPNNTSIAAHGFLVIEQGPSGFSLSAGTTPVTDANLTFSPSVLSTVVLTRPFTPDGGTSATSQLPVDEFGDQGLISTANIPSGTTSATAFSMQRPNDPAFAQPGVWACEDGNAVFSATPTLGAVNNVSANGMPGVPLYDRFYDALECPGYYSNPGDTVGVSAAAGSPLLNISDFANCPLFYSESQLINGAYVPIEMISDEVAALTKNTNEPNTNLQYEANARFDFFDDPAIAIPDPAAIKLLDYITFDSAFSDGSVADGAPAQNKLAVLGRINVNTASLPVLETMIGSFDGSTGGTTSPQSLATYIDQYRLRLGAYSSIPGNGFHSKAELTYALVKALNGVTPTSISARDNKTGFAELYNMATVRTDTFICYTYIQALRLNEAYIQNGGTYKATDWYNATQGITLGNEGSIYNVPSVQNGTNTVYPEFILEGQKRFAALIDRTNATTNGAGAGTLNTADPQVVALQSLPQ